MNINAADQLLAKHPALSAYRDQLSGPGPGGAARSSEAGTQDPYLTIGDLQKHWGQANAMYDLNGDGKVGSQDLLQLLAAGGTMTRPDAPITVDGMLVDFGRSDSVYDLDGDGTVGTSDLLMLLAEGGEMAAPPNGETHRAGDGAAPPAGLAAPEVVTKAETRPAEAKSESLNAPDRGKGPEIALRKISDALIGRLEKAGYNHRPPADIHQIVDRIGLKAEHRQTMLDRLAQRYPDGLGLRLRA